MKVNDLNGVLPVYKPSGMYTKDISRSLTKKFGKIKIGHAGTLDPSAEGVVPILLGRATRTQDILVGMEKEYNVCFRLGVATDTLDMDGKIVSHGDYSHVTADQVAAVTDSLVGTIEQIPPIYSAVKFQGRELYKWARAGVDIDLAALSRKVTIYQAQLLEYAPPIVRMSVRCSKGTYIRSLSTQLGAGLKTPCTVERIIRTLSSGFKVNCCYSLNDLLELSNISDLGAKLINLEQLPWQLKKIHIAKSHQRLLLDGGSIDVTDYYNRHYLNNNEEKVERVLILVNEDGVLGFGKITKLSDQQHMRLQRGLL